MTARLVDGWLVLDYTGPSMARIEIAVGRTEPGEWRPAFLDWHNGRRVAKIRPGDLPPQPSAWLRVAGDVRGVARIAT